MHALAREGGLGYLFLRGSCTKWKSAIGTDNGAGLPTIFA